MHPVIQAYQTRTRNSGHFFDRDTMRFFGSRLMGEHLYDATTGDVYFVTSELDFHGGDRRYTVRVLDTDGGIREASTFREHASRGVALRAMRRAYEASNA